ncbi:MAG: hypothetical protein Kow00129_05370 [Thermoleophilia bacterium]
MGSNLFHVTNDLRRTLDALPYYVMLVDEEHRVLFVNRAIAEAWNTEPEDLFGRYCPEAIHGLEDPYPGCPLEQAVAFGENVEKEFHLEESGSWVLSGIYDTGLTTELGRRVYLHTLVDRTAEKLLQRELEARRDELEHIFASSPTITYTGRLCSSRGLCLDWISGNTQEILGYPPEKVLEPGWWKRNVHPSDRQAAAHRPDLLAGEDGGTTRRYRLRHADGNYLWIEDSLRRDSRDEQGRIRIVGSWTDVGSLVEAEQALRRNEEQLAHSRRMEAVGRLAGGIAHDFNNLLTTIMSIADLVATEHPDDGPLGREMLEIRRAAELGGALTRQMLTFARRQPFHREVINVNKTIEDLLPLLSRSLGEWITLKPDLCSDPWPVEGDVTQLEQVLLNLALNARDAMPDGGELIIQTANAGPDDERLQALEGLQALRLPPGRFVRLSVIDEGVGMAPEVLDRAFEPFFTTKRDQHGTGLGLSTVFGIVKKCGGEIDVRSEMGVGTAFDVFLPAAPVQAVSQETGPSERQAEIHGGNEKILVVEDEPAIRELTARILRRQGYQVQTAADHEEAVARAQELEQPLDLILTDAILSGSNGMSVARDVRQLHPGVRHLLMSGYDETELATWMEYESRPAFIPKPFGPEELIRVVRQILDAQLTEAAP